MANPRKVVTKAEDGIRLGYVHLTAPWSGQPDQDPKYSCMLIIPKTATETLAAIERARQAAAEEARMTKFGGKIPSNLAFTLKDGDVDADLDQNPELAGHFYMRVSSTRKPGVVDRDLNPILDPSEIYSGMYARVSMNAFAYNRNGNKGVTFGLENVQKVKDGTPFGGGPARAEDDFEALPPEAAALL